MRLLTQLLIQLFMGGVFLLLIGCQADPILEPTLLANVPFSVGRPDDMVFQPYNNNMYVTNKVNGVGVFNDMVEIGVVPTDDTPIALAADAERGWVYVVNSYSDTVTIIQGTEVITTLETAGRDPRAVAVEAHSGWAYVVSPYKKIPPHGKKPVVDSHVTLISGTQIVGSVSLGNMAAVHVVADPLGGYVYVGGSGSDLVPDFSSEVVVLQGKQIVARYDVGPDIMAMDVNPNTGDVYVLNLAPDRNLTQFRAGQLIATMKVRSSTLNQRSHLVNMRVHPITGDIYIADLIQAEVIVVRDMQEIVALLPTGLGSLKMTIDPYSGNVYVANFKSNTVTAIHGTQVLTNINTGWFPYGIGVNPTNGRVYVSNTVDRVFTVTILGVEEK